MRNCSRALYCGVLLSLLAACLAQALPRDAMAASVAGAGKTVARSVDPDAMAGPSSSGTEQPVLLAQRLAAWEALPLAQRQERRARYLAWRALDESERVQLRQVAMEFAGFDEARRAALRQEFDALDASQRRGWQLGPVLGAGYARLHPLLAYVPAEQRLPMLEALRGLDAEQRADLATLAQRTPPQERQALREAFLAEKAERRAAWLQESLRH